MDKYEGLPKDELINKIKELETIVSALKEAKNQEELLNFPWIGNLGNWYWHVKSDMLLCNDQKVLVLNYSRDEIPDQMGFQFFTDKVHPEDYAGVMDNMRQHLYGKTSAYEVEYRIRTKDGKWKWYYDRGKVTKRDEYGKPELVAGIVFDITQRKEMEILITEQNKKLLEIVNIDYLTQLFNRKALYSKLNYEIRRAKRNKSHMSILMVDIDHFKSINDTYGHIAGDLILKKVAKTIQNSVREIDIVGRFGGEEFLVILPDTGSEQGLVVAERIRKNIEGLRFKNEIRVSISGGLKQYNQEPVDTFLDEADKLLYQAKNAGRNRIVV